MPEYLALPAWDAPARSLDEWVAALAGPAGPVVIRRESPTVAWLEAVAVGLWGYAVIEDGRPSAINFEILGPDPGPATAAIEAAAAALGWELDADEDDEDEDDE